MLLALNPLMSPRFMVSGFDQTERLRCRQTCLCHVNGLFAASRVYAELIWLFPERALLAAQSAFSISLPLYAAEMETATCSERDRHPQGTSFSIGSKVALDVLLLLS